MNKKIKESSDNNIIQNFAEKFIKNQKSLTPEVIELINENYWNLFDDDTSTKKTEKNGEND